MTRKMSEVRLHKCVVKFKNIDSKLLDNENCMIF